MEQMDCKPYQPLSKVKHEVDLTYTSSSDESEDGGKQRQSYDSRETLNEYSQELRLNYNSQSRKRKNIDQSTQDMEFCETPHILCSGYQTDLHGVAEHSYPLEVGSDVDTETEGGASPDHALRMWMRGMKSEHSSCLSSRANSALSLTDTDHERKSDGENDNAYGKTLRQHHGWVVRGVFALALRAAPTYEDFVAALSVEECDPQEEIFYKGMQRDLNIYLPAMEKQLNILDTLYEVHGLESDEVV